MVTLERFSLRKGSIGTHGHFGTLFSQERSDGTPMVILEHFPLRKGSMGPL
jgi:hypothetical protein